MHPFTVTDGLAELRRDCENLRAQLSHEMMAADREGDAEIFRLAAARVSQFIDHLHAYEQHISLELRPLHTMKYHMGMYRDGGTRYDTLLMAIASTLSKVQPPA